MSDFSFSDLGKVQWTPTIKLSLLRGFSAGLVFSIVFLFASEGQNLAVLLVLPFGWALAALPYALIFYFTGVMFGALIPLLGLWFKFMGSLMVFIGDPLVYLFNLKMPHVLNAVDLRFINFRPIIFITRPE